MSLCQNGSQAVCIMSANSAISNVTLRQASFSGGTVTYEGDDTQHMPFTQKVDVYSFGIVLWELITGMLPFQNMTAAQAAFAVVNKGFCPNIPTDCLPVLSDIMTRYWDPNPDVRPPFTNIVRFQKEKIKYKQQLL